jgi:hypothetical protein
MEHTMPNALFAAVIDAKSFSGATQRLKMPTSTMSRRIADLEKELGARLLERSTRKLRMTDLGAQPEPPPRAAPTLAIPIGLQRRADHFFRRWAQIPDAYELRSQPPR